MTDVHLPIGSGETHTIASSWAAATEIDLVQKALDDLSDAREFGEIKAGETVTDTIQLNLTGATVDIDSHRILTTDGAYYDVKAGTGSTFKTTFVTNASIYNPSSERYFKILGIRIFEDTTAPHTFNPTLLGEAKYSQFGYLTFQRTNASTANTASYPTIWVKATEALLYNSIIFGDGSDKSWRFGIRCGNPAWVLNNILYKMETTGINVQNGAGLCNNNIAMATDVGNDIDYTSGSRTNNISSDATATGTNSHASESVSNIFVDADNQDFNLKASTNAVDGGLDNSGKFADDYLQVTRGATFDIGAIEFAAAGASIEEFLKRPFNIARRM